MSKPMTCLLCNLDCKKIIMHMYTGLDISPNTFHHGQLCSRKWILQPKPPACTNLISVFSSLLLLLVHNRQPISSSFSRPARPRQRWVFPRNIWFEQLSASHSWSRSIETSARSVVILQLLLPFPLIQLNYDLCLRSPYIHINTSICAGYCLPVDPRSYRKVTHQLFHFFCPFSACFILENNLLETFVHLPSTSFSMATTICNFTQASINTICNAYERIINHKLWD